MSESIFKLSGKNIIITGASSGIGREVAIFCSEMGANIGLLGRKVEKLEDVKKQLQPGNHHILSCDLNDPSFNDLFVQFLTHYNKIDGFVHSAGIELTKPLSITSEKDFADNFQLNVVKGFMIAKIISNKKYLSDNSSYVFISSIMSVVGQPGKIVYASSKGALVAGARAMALEYAPKKIRINTISPALVDTPMSQKMLKDLPEESATAIEKAHPLGIGKPTDIAGAAVFLLTNASSWITGINLIVDGGYTLK